MSAFAMFSLKAPSFLAFDKERAAGHLRTIYGASMSHVTPTGGSALIPSPPRCSVRCAPASFDNSSAARHGKR